MNNAAKKPRVKSPPSPRSETVRVSSRCIQCQEPGCTGGCPIGITIPSVVALLSSGRVEEAAALTRLRSPLASITGRLCPSNRFCEHACALTRKGIVFPINKIETFLGDISLNFTIKQGNNAKGRVLVVGSGPAGLTAAHDLRVEGFAVTVFEREPQLGGWLRGLPSDMIPVGILDSELARLARSGIVFETSRSIEPTDGFPPKGYYATVLTTGPLTTQGSAYPVKRSDEGFIVVDEQYRTSKPFVYAAGGAIARFNSITEAMASAREMAGNVLRDQLFPPL